MIFGFEGKFPVIHSTVFVAESAVIIGDVEIGENSSIWFVTVIRGDVHFIRIGKEVNIQDGCIVHVEEGLFPTLIGNRVTIGHRAIIHGVEIGEECLIGMGATILSGAKIGKHSIIAAGSVVREKEDIPEGSLVVGVPGKIKRKVSDDEIKGILMSAERYKELAKSYIK